MLNANQVPWGDHYNDFKQLVHRKHSAHRPILDALLNDLRGRFETFEANRIRLELVPQVTRTDTQCDALKSCYKDGNKFLSDLLELLGFADGNQPVRLCPYCQLFPVGAWDHFLPSTDFPDFYAHPLNLVRACKHCNEDKGANRVVPLRETIHPYFDALHIWYLRCTVAHDGNFTVEFAIDPDVTDPDYDAYVHAVVERHFAAYELGRKFRAEASRKIADFTTNMAKIAEIHPISILDVEREIRHERAKLIRQGEGPNSWQLAFWDGMARCVGLDQIIRSDPLVGCHSAAVAGVIG